MIEFAFGAVGILIVLFVVLLVVFAIQGDSAL